MHFSATAIDRSTNSAAGLSSHVVSFQSQRSAYATQKLACQSCHLNDMCMPLGLSFDDVEKLNNLINVRKRVKRGGALYRNGEEFAALYAIRTGFLKPWWPPTTDTIRSPAFRCLQKFWGSMVFIPTTTPVMRLL